MQAGTVETSAYMGFEQAVILQKTIEARADVIAERPLLANGGRILNILGPDAYGRNKIRADVRRDGTGWLV